MMKYLKGIWTRFLVSYALMPAILFLGFGLYSIWKQELLFPMLLSFAVAALFTVVVLVIVRKGKPEASSKIDDMPNIEVSSEWTEKEREVWDKAMIKIDAFVDTPFDLTSTKEDIIELVDFIARESTGDRKRGYLSFTTPEALLMLEEVSKRYRLYLDNNVPLVSSLKISRLKMAYDHKDKAKFAWNLYRVFRLTTPTGIASEVRGILTEGIADEMTDSAIVSLRRVFFQEIASVAIDLYGGRFVLLSNDLTAEAKKDLDRIKEAEECNEPIRITIVGQTSAGKSTLKNALFGELKSEVGALATTEDDIVSKINLNNNEFHVIDTVGFNSDMSGVRATLDRIKDSDLVIWCLKSNQPSKNPDANLATEIEAYYAKNYKKVKPVFVFALTHSDLIDEEDKGEVSIYNSEIVSTRLSLPRYNMVSTGMKGEGIDDIYSVIQNETKNALASRMNRKRLRASKSNVIKTVKSDIDRAKNLAKAIHGATIGNETN